MRTTPTDRMKDPFYAGLLFQIERIICQADEEAKNRGLQLTDSQVRSTLVKTRKKLLGGSPEIPKTNVREEILAELVWSLALAPVTMMKTKTAKDGTKEEHPLDLAEWVNGLETVESSMKTRAEKTPGSRGYLDFVHGFIAQAEMAKELQGSRNKPLDPGKV